MKNNNEIDISFAGDEASEFKLNEVENTTVLQITDEEAPEKEGETVDEQSDEVTPEAEAQEEVNSSDAYTVAIESLFVGYQAFQEGMQSLTKSPNPKFLMGKLASVLEGFQLAIAQFKDAEFEVPVDFLEGHAFIVEAIQQYDVFLVEYPAVLSGKGGLKAMKKVAKLGKLNASADQNMKKAFRSFDEATKGA